MHTAELLSFHNDIDMSVSSGGAALFFCFVSLGCSFDCRNQDGSAVDWFIIYKLPILSGNVNRLAADGAAYYYMDNGNPQWTLSNVGINEMQGNAVYYTLQQIYDQRDLDNFTYAMYNDEPPVGSYSSYHGHTKGAFAFDKSSGFWLIVSVPKFPNNRTGGYQYPTSGFRNGQTMLCVSLNYTDLEDIAEIFLYTYPKFYDKHLPDSLAGNNPILASVFHYGQKHVITAPYQLETTMQSKGDTTFHNFAKATGFKADLYDAWLNKRLNHSLLVETWQIGRKENFIKSNCTQNYNVYNIQELVFPIGSFRETKDHSKWAVSRTGKWICIGDINRQYSQFKRGGGTMCFDHTEVWSQFIQRIRDYETCGVV